MNEKKNEGRNEKWMNTSKCQNKWMEIKKNLTLYTLRSVWILSILLFIHFLGCWQGEFVYQSKASFVADHFFYSHDFNVWFRDDIVRRN